MNELETHCHSDRATKERRGIPQLANTNLLKNVRKNKTARNAQDEMPLLPA